MLWPMSQPEEKTTLDRGAGPGEGFLDDLNLGVDPSGISHYERGQPSMPGMARAVWGKARAEMDFGAKVFAGKLQSILERTSSETCTVSARSF